MAFNARFAEDIAQLQELNVVEQPSSLDRNPDISQAAHSKKSLKSARKSDHSVVNLNPKNFEQSILKYDCFKRPFEFQLPNGYESLATRSGCFCSLLLLLILTAYGAL